VGRDRVACLLLALACVSAVAGCGADGGGGGVGSPASTAAAPRRFTNPVLTGNFADPYMLKVGNTWYAYATGDLVVNLQVARSADLVRWQRLAEDGLKLEGRPRSLGVRNDAAWERDLIEAPTLWREGDTHYLFYSANDYGSTSYAVGYATATRVLGSYRDGPGNPILRSRGRAAGPGGQAVVRDADGDLWLADHAWDSSAVGDEAGGQRSMWLDRLRFQNNRPKVEGPTDEPQEAP
jgi:beta-xylosidase